MLFSTVEYIPIKGQYHNLTFPVKPSVGKSHSRGTKRPKYPLPVTYLKGIHQWNKRWVESVIIRQVSRFKLFTLIFFFPNASCLPQLLKGLDFFPFWLPASTHILLISKDNITVCPSPVDDLSSPHGPHKGTIQLILSIVKCWIFKENM